ncbi:hypothetical protein E3Q22_01450 [Wallemia mellicola]|uniref:Uncharacterized protein n=2 Tax=Wallemia mellicola TaxID=1708541 RepID=A0A4T0Q5L8_9BASI|nr:hypothetical protein WALSEDRAFT_61161 [Wallemia mellicola CBS 633.66]TIB73054.1 hypothetical protein E3Q24_01317 [Wallemia mellicola]EIM20169.1 hypothetical protein WALSEDRAFT_61161 [Wallemia mellicola CBS 633.66]TIB81025.1 hypothetical protein E3Q22_01450 [Wallemia mellicola]TIB87114.1 hypothetical protein E3Q21_01369 [Wallemia mellicola]TIB90189.1 hypothetical protein E3Q20_01356 [Wallemia mellicola]|eukprot:XP_006959889.1 hypothetical protein WALSEDRAFT_61161 [Wallemia mellicola CBS 633.66]
MDNKENPVEQLHHPEAAAVVEDQNDDKGAGQRALLAQKLKQTSNSFVSPTDNLMTPVTAKLANHKKKNFSKAKPVQLTDRFQSTLPTDSPQSVKRHDNPFDQSESSN